MTQTQFEAKVRQLEIFARENPGAYRVRVVLLAALGYGFIAGIILAIVGLLATLLFFTRGAIVLLAKLAIPLVLFIGFLCRLLWVKLPVPQGRELTRRQAPKFFDFLREAEEKLESPRVHRVLLDNDFNAGIVQIPKLGILGWTTNYLVIGLPLLHALSQDHFKAVLAHELGHISGNHGGFTAWIYRLRTTWGALQYHVEEEDRFGYGLFRRFLNWYAPMFNAYTFVLARMQEYEADRAAADMVGKLPASEALIETAIKAPFYEDAYWSEVLKKADDIPHPVGGVFSGMNVAYQHWITSERISRSLESALMAETGYADTHPCLTDRLVALGYVPESFRQAEERRVDYVPPTVKFSAGEAFLGPILNSQLNFFDTEWQRNIQPRWQERYQYAAEAKVDLKRLEALDRESLGDEDLFKLASLTIEFRTAEEIEPVLRDVLSRHPDQANANFHLGLILLERKDDAGVAHLEKAMKADSEATMDVCRTLFGYFMEQGREVEAETYRLRARRHQDLLNLAARERREMTQEDELSAHRLDPATLSPLYRQFAAIEGIRTIRLARKDVRYLPEYPLFILGIEPDISWFHLNRSASETRVLSLVADTVEYPFRVLIYILNDESRWLSEKFRFISDSVIYTKP